MKAKIQKFDIPEEVSGVTRTLKNANFEAFLVGGCVRDLFMGRKPKDWDVTTNAKPEQIIALFPKTFYENDFGTVAVVTPTHESVGGPTGSVSHENSSQEALKIIEVTPYRLEGEYSDHRRPDSVQFSHNIQDDLKRRDFTMNSIAYDPETGEIIDPFGGISDLAKKMIKAVGDPNQRFSEDGLRMIRSIRFHVELGFELEKETEKAIAENAFILKDISKERIRDEFVKIIMSPSPSDGIITMRKLGLLGYIIPELEDAVGVEQNQAHSYDVWNHLLKTVQHSADKGYPLHVRLAALLHDIAKPKTRRWAPSVSGGNKEGGQWTFYGHEVVGSHVTKKILENLKFSRETIKRVSNLVRWHMFFSDTETITHSAVRRLIANVGKENVWDLIDVRLCDRVGTGRPKENPYRLRKFQSMIEEVMADPISVGMLKINGAEIMKILSIGPGPKVGQILNALLEEVLENPSLNKEDYLSKKVLELNSLSENELIALSERGKSLKDKEEEKKIKDIRDKHHVA